MYLSLPESGWLRFVPDVRFIPSSGGPTHQLALGAPLASQFPNQVDAGHETPPAPEHPKATKKDTGRHKSAKLQNGTRGDPHGTRRNPQGTHTEPARNPSGPDRNPHGTRELGSAPCARCMLKCTFWLQLLLEPDGTRWEPARILLHVWGETHGYACSHICGTRLNPHRNPPTLKDALDGMHVSGKRPTTNIYY